MNPAHHETDPRQLLQQMLLIRTYEEAIVAGSTAGTVPGTCTSVGQEAAAVGVVNALTPDDLILTNHRSAGHLLARGADPGRLLAEVMGRSDGYCGGRSGSLHISARELGVVLTSTIVGADEIIVLDHGRIVERGNHAALLAAQGRYAEMWALQQSSEV